MPDYEIGVRHRFTSIGQDAMRSAQAGFTGLTNASDRFIASSTRFAIAAGAMGVAGYALTRPFSAIKDAAMGAGTEFEVLHLQIRALMGNNSKMADEMYRFMAKAAVDSPFTFKEILGNMRQFIYLGINARKEYGDIFANMGGDVQKFKATAVTALSGLAAATGAGMGTLTQHIATAIKQGRADYLEYWIGPIEMMRLQMSGAFIGTYQQQFDKVIGYLNGRFGALGKQMTMTMSGILLNWEDLMQQMQVSLSGTKLEGSAFKKLEAAMGGALSKLTDFLMPLTGLHRLTELGKVMSEVLMPIARLAEYALPKLVEYIEKMVRYAIDPRNRTLVVMFGKLGLAGAAFLAASAFLSMTASFLGFLGSIGLGLGVIKAMLGLFLSVPLAIAVGGLAFARFRNNWQEVRGWFGNFFSDIRKDFEWFSNLISVMFEIWTTETGDGVARFSKAAYDALGPDAQNFVGAFQMAVHKLKGGHKATWTDVLHKLGLDLGRGFLSGIWETLADKDKTPLDKFANILGLTMQLAFTKIKWAEVAESVVTGLMIIAEFVGKASWKIGKALAVGTGRGLAENVYNEMVAKTGGPLMEFKSGLMDFLHLSPAAEAFGNRTRSALNTPLTGADALGAMGSSATQGAPGLAVGTSYVPFSGLYNLHKGESVIPADKNRGMSSSISMGGINITIHASGGAGNDWSQITDEMVREIERRVVELQARSGMRSYNYA